MPNGSRVFSALLRYWRGQRGMSQLDLALAADVSSRHVSFLETGRSRPSREMVLRLGSTLDVPLREQNAMLREAGFAPAFEVPALEHAAVDHALEAMLRHHEPFPMLVVDAAYDGLRLNAGARSLAEALLGSVPEAWNAMRAFLAPAMIETHLVDGEATARSFLARLHREALRAPHDDRLATLLDDVLRARAVPEAWRTPDLTAGAEGAVPIRFRVGDEGLSFVVAMTAFHAPQNVTLDEIRIESFFPTDAATEAACERLLGSER